MFNKLDNEPWNKIRSEADRKEVIMSNEKRRIEKVVLNEYVGEIFKGNAFIYLVSYKGLSVAAMNDLRAKLYEIDARVLILKNTFIKLGLAAAEIELPEDFSLTGDTAIVYGEAVDPCPAAKALKAYSKENEELSFKGGVVEGKFQTATGVEELADLPPKEVLLSQLLGVMKAPGTKLVRVLSNRKSSLVWVLENLANKLENK